MYTLCIYTEPFKNKKSYKSYVPENIGICLVKDGLASKNLHLTIPSGLGYNKIRKGKIEQFDRIVELLKEHKENEIVYCRIEDYNLMYPIFIENGASENIVDNYILNDMELKRINGGCISKNNRAFKENTREMVKCVNLKKYHTVPIEHLKVPEDYDVDDIKTAGIVRTVSGDKIHKSTCGLIKRTTTISEGLVDVPIEDIGKFKLCERCMNDKDRKYLMEMSEKAIKYREELKNYKLPSPDELYTAVDENDKKAKFVKVHDGSIVEDTKEQSSITLGDKTYTDNDINTTREEQSEQMEIDTAINIKVDTQKEHSKITKGTNHNIVDAEGFPLDISQLDPLGRKVIEICNRCGLYATIYEHNVHITTAAGSWVFNYMENPITLYHRNYETKHGGGAIEQCHVQGDSFNSILDAIEYLVNHDNDRIKRFLDKLNSYNLYINNDLKA